MLLILFKMMPLVLMTLVGYVLNRLKIIDKTFNRQLSLTLINVFYPCLIINLMVRNFTPASLLECWTMPAGLVFILCAGWFFGLLTRKLLCGEKLETRRCYHFICMMNNYSFLPIMMAASMWGDKAVALIIFSALGSELAIWTLGIRTLTGDRLSIRSLKHLCSMPMVALMVSFIIIYTRAILTKNGINLNTIVTEFNGQMMESFKFLSGATIPVSAIVCGSRIASMKASHIFNPLMAGTCLMRLIIIPAFCIGFICLVPLEQDIRRLLILIAVQPAAMASVALSEAYRSDAEFAAAATFATHILCLITIPLWLVLLP
ncbi:MAG: AEC family transporter [Kiritimatiellia bacterium]